MDCYIFMSGSAGAPGGADRGEREGDAGEGAVRRLVHNSRHSECSQSCDRKSKLGLCRSFFEKRRRSVSQRHDCLAFSKKDLRILTRLSVQSVAVCAQLPLRRRPGSRELWQCMSKRLCPPVAVCNAGVVGIANV